MQVHERVERLLRARADYAAAVPKAYDEVIDQVAVRVANSGDLGKLDIGALVAWKRLCADTPWMAQLMSTPDSEVRRTTQIAVTAARDRALDTPEAARGARSALSALPGFDRGDAVASVVCFVAAPDRLAVYDRRAHQGLLSLGLSLSNAPGRYRRYTVLVEQCRGEVTGAGVDWTARDVDVALFELGRR